MKQIFAILLLINLLGACQNEASKINTNILDQHDKLVIDNEETMIRLLQRSTEIESFDESDQQELINLLVNGFEINKDSRNTIKEYLNNVYSGNTSTAEKEAQRSLDGLKDKSLTWKQRTQSAIQPKPKLVE